MPSRLSVSFVFYCVRSGTQILQVVLYLVSRVGIWSKAGRVRRICRHIRLLACRVGLVVIPLHKVIPYSGYGRHHPVVLPP